MRLTSNAQKQVGIKITLTGGVIVLFHTFSLLYLCVYIYIYTANQYLISDCSTVIFRVIISIHQLAFWGIVPSIYHLIFSKHSLI